MTCKLKYLKQQRMMNCFVLQRNFAECVDACQTNLDPTDRKRHYSPLETVDKDPLVRDFGRFAQEMARLKIYRVHLLICLSFVFLTEYFYWHAMVGSAASTPGV